MEAAENGVLSLGEIFSNEDMVSDLDHLPEGADVSQAAAVKKARIDGNAARDVGLRKQVRFCLI